MPRKKHIQEEASNSDAIETPSLASAPQSIPRAPKIDGVGFASDVLATRTAVEIEGPTPSAQQSEPEKKQFANPYSAIFTSVAKGFEMGEHRQFKQRVFKFNEKPEQAIIDTLMKHGFTYRPREKSWTIHATAATRELTEQLARTFSAGTQEHTR
jgi:hypothetical protein